MSNHKKTPPANNYRFINPDMANLRASENEAGQPIISGYASVFNQESRVLWDWWDGFFIEKIENGAFDNVLQTDNLDVTFNRNHDDNILIGRTLAGNLLLSIDDVGLYYRAEVGNTTAGRDAYEDVKAGNIFESSFAFTFDDTKTSWSENEQGLPVRTLHKNSIINLYDVSIVTRGAYQNTDVNTNSIKRAIQTLFNSENNITPAKIMRMYGAPIKSIKTLPTPEQVAAQLKDQKRRLSYINKKII